jgi:hypothetical protein
VTGRTGREEGFIGGLELALFTAVIATVMLGMVELCGVRVARDTKSSFAHLAAVRSANGFAQDTHWLDDLPASGGYAVTIGLTGDDCGVVQVSVTATHAGVVSGRQYRLAVDANWPVTRHRDFSLAAPAAC